MFTPLPTPDEMRRWDEEAIRFGVPAFGLMENAAREALHALTQAVSSDLSGRRVLLFMGGGNNGGDAVCLARHLCDIGADTLVIHTRPWGAYRDITARHLRLARQCGVTFLAADKWLRQPRTPLSPQTFDSPDIVVDGLLGTGFSGTLRERELALVRCINHLRNRAFVLALDIPSGLNGLSGLPCPEAVQAHLTVSFEAAQPGMVLPCASPYVGTLAVRRIGMPAAVRSAHPASFCVLDETRWRDALPPAAIPHKGKAGHVLVVGGSARYPGAAHLAALGAAHAGAGLVTVAAPAAHIDAVRGHNPGFMPFALPGDRWTPDSAAALAPLLPSVDALVLGPGLGQAPDTAAMVSTLLAMPRPPAIVDADALLADALPHLSPLDILTPHPGEAARLLACSVADIQADRPAALQRLTALAPAVWLLKGEGTLIGQAHSPTAILPFSVPQLAVGGSGDVLAGCAAALLAQLLAISPHTSFTAACLAARLHIEAGLHLAPHFPRRGNPASLLARGLQGVTPCTPQATNTLPIVKIPAQQGVTPCTPQATNTLPIVKIPAQQGVTPCTP